MQECEEHELYNCNTNIFFKQECLFLDSVCIRLLVLLWPDDGPGLGRN